MQLLNNQQTPSSSTPDHISPGQQIPEQSTPEIKTNSISARDLIQGIQKNNTNNFVVGATNTKEQDSVSIAQEMRFLSVRYKVYSFIIIVVVLLIMSPVQTALQTSREKWQSLENIKLKINTVINNQQKYEDEKKLFEDIEKNKDILILCVNQGSRCDQLPENIKKNIEAIKAYIQLGNLHRSKMDVDEAKILKNINEYMLQKNILGGKISYNGTVTSISINTPQKIENNIIKVPLSLLISFEKKEDLLSFLNNVENYIFTDSKNGLDAAVLFRIETLQYDIVNYKESQDVEVSLSAYAYNDK